MLKINQWCEREVDLTGPDGVTGTVTYSIDEDRLALRLKTGTETGTKDIRRDFAGEKLRAMAWSLDFLGFQLAGMVQELLDLPTLAGCGEPEDYSAQIRPLWDFVQQGREATDASG